MKRNAFTMIELIFVIVILGILAAIAIPKLAATRDDANIASELTNVTQVINNAAAEYTARGSYTNGYNSTKCYSFATAIDGNFTVTETIGDARDNTMCGEVHTLGRTRDINGTKQNGGTRVVW